jgi:hypothetical protein
VIEDVEAGVAVIFSIVGHLDFEMWLWKTRRGRESTFGDVISKEKKVTVLSIQFSTSTLMPPPHRFLAPRLRGYVCRACLSKSQVTPRQQPLWLSRNSTNARSPQSKGVSQQVDLPEPEIREFEQTADGIRTEIQDDLLQEIKEEIRMIEKKEGKSIEEIVGPVDFESFLKDDGQQTSFDPIMGESMAASTKRTEELEALVKRLDSISDFSTLSPEDRSKLREELLMPLTTGI